MGFIQRALAGTAIATLLGLGTAHADIHVGVVLSLTGPGASLGLPEQDAIKLWPTSIAGQKLKVTVLNDATDPTTAAKNTSKLLTEDKVDVIVGSSTTPPSLAMVQVAAAEQTAMISLAGGGAIVEPVDDKKRWAFKLGPPEKYAIELIADHVKKNNGKTLGVVAFATAYGEGFLKLMENAANARGIKIVALERYNPTDQSVTAQMTKIMALNPDAIFIAASGTPGALPQLELTNRGYKGMVYQTQGIANNDFIRVGGKAVEGTFVTVAPVLVAEQLADSDPIKKPAVAFVQAFEGKFGANSRSLFAATAWDSVFLLERAAEFALKKAQPGTAAFRVAMRDGLESIKDLVTAEAVYSYSASDHNGVDQRCQVLVRIENGKWRLVK